METKNNRGEIITNSDIIDYMTNKSHYENAINKKMKKIISFMNDEGAFREFRDADFFNPTIKCESQFLADGSVQFLTNDMKIISIPWVVFRIENPHEASIKWVRIIKNQRID